jgi:hypothetical protein
MSKVAMGGGVFLAPGYQNEESVLSRFQIRNPEYDMAMGMRKNGKYVPIPDKHINACHRIPLDHPWGGGLAVPRKAASQMNLGNIIDVRTAPDARLLTLSKGFSLRDYQQSALNAWLKNKGEGVIVAPCGAGKTAIGVSAMTKFNTKALVLVHTNDLAVQWMNRIRSMLNEEATQYGAGKKDDSGRIVVATFQTLERMSFTERYQCHVLYASETPTRIDGHTRATGWADIDPVVALRAAGVRDHQRTVDCVWARCSANNRVAIH